MINDPDWTQVCEQATWVLVFRRLDHDVYACESAGEVSLVDQQTLINILRQRLGGTNGLGEESVG